MDANVDVTYDIWHFNVQGWLDLYDEASMHPISLVASKVLVIGLLITRGHEYLIGWAAEVHRPYIWERVQLQ